MSNYRAKTLKDEIVFQQEVPKPGRGGGNIPPIIWLYPPQ